MTKITFSELKVTKMTFSELQDGEKFSFSLSNHFPFTKVNGFYVEDFHKEVYYCVGGAEVFVDRKEKVKFRDIKVGERFSHVFFGEKREFVKSDYHDICIDTNGKHLVFCGSEDVERIS